MTSLSPKVTHIITGLNDGGAENALFRLVTNDRNITHVVISMMDEGKYGPLMKDAGIQVHALNMERGRFQIAQILELYKLIQSLQPDAVQTWMYHADLVGGLASRAAGIKNVNWGIRHSTFSDLGGVNTARIVAQISGILSRIVPSKIVSVAHAAIEPHTKMLYDKRKFVVIHNGYDFGGFAPNEEKRLAFRTELGVAANTPLLGYVARYNKQKDHRTLIQALRLVKNQGYNFRLALVGAGMSASNIELLEKLKANNLTENTSLLGQRTDIPTVMNGLDVHIVSSAFGEGFPNVLAEAMACGTPCITTDVGDASMIVDSHGWVVPPSSPESLADTILDALIELSQSPTTFQTRKVVGEHHVKSNFSIEAMIDRYHTTWFGDIQ